MTEQKGSKGHALLIRCSDGMTTKPRQLHGYWVHQIRQPGGILFPDLCALRHPGSEQTSEMNLMLAIQVMVDLKHPDIIALLAHEPCGAGLALGLTPDGVKARHVQWQQRLQSCYPEIPVKLFYEPHSECGCEREPHLELSPLRSAA